MSTGKKNYAPITKAAAIIVAMGSARHGAANGRRHMVEQIEEGGLPGFRLRPAQVMRGAQEHGIGKPGEDNKAEKKFEYLILVLIDTGLKLNKMLEISWDEFMKYKRWHKTMQAWNISITDELLKNSKIIYSNG